MERTDSRELDAMLDLRDAYDCGSETYDDDLNLTRDLAYRVVRWLLPSRCLEGCHVLELGSGTGAITEWLLAHAARVVAMDASPRMLARARARHKEPVSLVEHDADRISLSRQAFSAVFGYAKHLLGSKGVLVLKMP